MPLDFLPNQCSYKVQPIPRTCALSEIDWHSMPSVDPAVAASHSQNILSRPPPALGIFTKATISCFVLSILVELADAVAANAIRVNRKD